MNENKTTLRELLEKGQVIAPCVYDCLSVRCVELAGFEAALLSGGAYAYSMCGIPDMGLLNPDELLWMTTRMTDYSPLPIIVDADEGYGESPLNTYRTVMRLAKAGAMAVTIDDSTGIRGWERQFNESEGPLQVVSREVFLSKIKAAVEAVKNTDCMVIARTEALVSQYGIEESAGQANGASSQPFLVTTSSNLGMDEALERCLAARALGADMTLVIGLKTLEQGKLVAERDPGWKMWPDVSVTDGRSDVDLADIEKLGFNLVTMHYTEKAAMFGMLDYGMRAMKDQNTVYVDEHDFDGWLPGKDHHILLSYWKKWMPMEDEFNDLADLNARSYDIKFE
ncbi:MAG: isocitrate lyase/PEP mutase family protein [Anaerolineales bacterium]|jgi:2-methylisocitrate lyase-like PEP mutase family enzyme